MHTLFLLRHAKSSWEDLLQEDIKRPLNKRGKNDAPHIGRFLAEKGDVPDLIISSTAKRALSTAKRVASATGYDTAGILKDKRLYMAGIDDFLSVISQVDNKVKQLMLVSHNYGITDFANFISNSDIQSIPTCGIVKIKFDSGDWKDVLYTKGKLIYFEFPKNILR
ncbi:MAG: histidine phosphatase family protein [Ignavibacteria bacterium]|nr:histidine phosphatase family protein [Ignavibacteria bacterium]MCC7158626.1 histidine phosphatase family protein [Ignavibacteria bacterium]